MPQKFKILYLPVAVDDMDEIFSYIAADNYEAANNLLKKIDAAVKLLGEFPKSGTILSEDDYPLIKRGYRFIIVHPYMIFYFLREKEKKVIINRILHGKRDYLRNLFNLNL